MFSDPKIGGTIFKTKVKLTYVCCHLELQYGGVDVMKGWVQFLIKVDGTCLINKLILITVCKPCQCKK